MTIGTVFGYFLYDWPRFVIDNEYRYIVKRDGSSGEFAKLCSPKSASRIIVSEIFVES